MNARADLALLSERERAILEFICGGGSSKGIAKALNRAPGTIKIQTRRLYGKLGASNRAHLAYIAGRLGVVSRQCR